MKYHYSNRCFTHRMKRERHPFNGLTFSGPWFVSIPAISRARPCNSSLRDTGQVGSLAGAAYLLNNNAGVLRRTQ